MKYKVIMTIAGREEQYDLEVFNTRQDAEYYIEDAIDDDLDEGLYETRDYEIVII